MDEAFEVRRNHCDKEDMQDNWCFDECFVESEKVNLGSGLNIWSSDRSPNTPKLVPKPNQLLVDVKPVKFDRRSYEP